MGKAIFIFVFFFTVCIQNLCYAQGQISVDKTTHDFSQLDKTSSRFADFIFTNEGSEKVFILRWEAEDDITTRISSLTIEPGKKSIVRIQYNPGRRGSFTRKIKIFISSSDKPIELRLTGNATTIDENMSMQCPDFNTPADGKAVHGDFVVKVIDQATGSPINGANIEFSPGYSIIPFFTDESGIKKLSPPIGRYQITASAKNYSDSTARLYISKQGGEYIFALVPKVSDPILVVTEEETDIEIDTPDLPDFDVYVEKPGELKVNEYSRNNIVFLIDVSSSMASPDKLPLLKQSMTTMLTSLRGIDKISIVTYASGTTIALETVEATDKERIAEIINKLNASGMTEGGKGIREAYRIAELGFIPGGNNQIILATDGDFDLDRSDQALFRFIEKKTQHGITLSVVGFGKKPKAIEKMQKIALSGHGSYIHIDKDSPGTTALLDEIKYRSRK